MIKMICFDMDGTIADLYGVDNWLEKLRSEDVSPYRDAEPIYNMEVLATVLNILISQGWEVRVISWLSKGSTEEYKKAVRLAKIEWLERYGFPYKTAHLVAYGATKADSVRRVASPAILVDDNRKVRDGWHLGATIDPVEENLIDCLIRLIEKEC